MTGIFPARPRHSKDASRARIHTFIATSQLHMEKKLRMSPEEVLEQARRSGPFCTESVLAMTSSSVAEDGYRSDTGFFVPVCWKPSLQEGATTLNIPDTVGYAIPELYGNFIQNPAGAHSQFR
jgi:2-isopropylmalate synthase